jgi:hypothetical protein
VALGIITEDQGNKLLALFIEELAAMQRSDALRDE